MVSDSSPLPRVPIRALALVLATMLVAASCTDSDAGSEQDPEATAGEETFADASETEPDLVLSARPGPFQISVDELPSQVGPGAVLEVRAPDGAAAGSAPFADNGTALIRGLAPGRVEAFVVDGDIEWNAGAITVPGEEAPATELYAATELQPGLNYLPTRDGTTLSAFVTLPGSATDGPYPTLVEYSGYSPSNPEAGDDPNRILIPALGYALVQVNVRGTGCSGGSFDTFERIQSLDGYDVIEAVAEQAWAGKVGMFGVSYPGIMQLHVASTRPPSLAAIAPLSVIDRVDSVLYPGGIYNNGFGETWTREVSERAGDGGQDWAADRVARGDLSCTENQRFRVHNPDLVDVVQGAPYVSDLSRERSPETWATDIDAPVFLAGAWQDEQTGPGFPALFDELADNDGFRAVLYNGLHADPVGPDVLVKLIEFYNIYVGERDPAIDAVTQVLIEVGLTSIFGDAVELTDGRYWGLAPTEARARFEADPAIQVQFEHGGTAPNLPVSSFEIDFEQWPPAEVEPAVFHFTADGLVPEPPDESTTFEFTTDPAEGAVTTSDSLDRIWTSDPGWVWPTPDPANSVTLTTPALADDLVAVGGLSVDLWVSLPDEDDADLEVTVSDVGPDGSETYVQSGWLRLSRRALSNDATELRPVISGLEDDVAPLRPGAEPVEARVEVPPFGHVFHAGGSLRVTIDTPGASRPQWRFDVLPEPTAVTVHSDPDRPSRIVVPAVGGVDVPTERRPACGTLRGQPCREG